jgi:hypothetical protein
MKKRSAARIDEPIPDEVSLPALPRHRKQDDRDPREPLKIGLAGIDQGEARPLNTAVDTKQLVAKYARNLTAMNGDVALALAVTYEIPVEEAKEKMLELHDHICGASKAHTDLSDLFERFDLGTPVLLARLREMLFSPKEAVALKAIEMATEMNATSKAKRIGTTWEQLVAGVRAKAKADLLRKKTA